MGAAVTLTIVEADDASPLISVAFTVAVYERGVEPLGPVYVCGTVAFPDRLPRLCDVPSPKSMVALRRLLEPVDFEIVNTTVAVFADELACTAAQLPVPAAGVQVIVRPGPTRISTVTAVLVFVPAVAVTLAFCPAVRNVLASPLLLVVATALLSVP